MEIRSKVGMWEWKTTGRSEMTFSDRLGQFENTFGSRYEVLRKLPNVECAWIDVYLCEYESVVKEAGVEFLIEPVALKTLYDFGLPVDFTFRMVPGEPENPAVAATPS
jgi:hypothetical protein